MEPKKKSEDNSFRLFFPIILAMMGITMIASRSGSSYHYVPLPARPRITSISPTEPAVGIFKKYAESHHLTWKVGPDQIDGTSYCATLEKDFNFAVGCQDTLVGATDEAVKNWEGQQVAIGSKK